MAYTRGALKLSCATVGGAVSCGAVTRAWTLRALAFVVCRSFDHLPQREDARCDAMRCDAIATGPMQLQGGNGRVWLKGKNTCASQRATVDDGWSRPKSAKCDCAARAQARSEGARRGAVRGRYVGMRAGAAKTAGARRVYAGAQVPRRVPFLGGAMAEGRGGRVCEEKRVHVSEIRPVGGAKVFMREKAKARRGR